MMVSDEPGLRREIMRVIANLDAGEWITEGLLGACEQWAQGDSGEARSNKAEVTYMVVDGEIMYRAE